MERRLETKDIRIDDEMMSLLVTRIAEVQAKGFGDVTAYIRNGYIYRVRASSEDYISEDFRPEGVPACER